MKKKIPTVAVAAPPVALSAKPDIFADRLAQLSPEQKALIRSWLAHPLYAHLMRMVAVFKPSSNVTNGGSGPRDAFSDARCNARLGEIRGWELHEAAIFLALNEPPQVKQAVQEAFQAVDADWNKPVGSTETEKK